MNTVHTIANNQLALLENGAEYFPRLCADLDLAQHSVYLETYIFAADASGQKVAQALQAAALRGVAVRVLLDGFGSAHLSEAWLDEMRGAGVQVLWFRRDISPFTMQRSRLRRLRRLHRKLAVIDDSVAYLGGINIIDDVDARSGGDAPRLDYAVRVQGEMASEIRAAMVHLWHVVTWAMLRRRDRSLHFQVPRKSAAHQAKLTLLLRDNLRHRRDIERAYLTEIARARHEIIIANAYFLPGRVFRRALVHAANRGVKVVLLLQGKVEYRLQHYATRALYHQLLAAGVVIHEYQASYMHAKVAVVDGLWATVGSSNIDPLSLLLAREANLAVRDAAYAQELRASLMKAIARDGRQIVLADLHQLSWIARLTSRVSYAVIRFIMGVLGYGKGVL